MERFVVGWYVQVGRCRYAGLVWFSLVWDGRKNELD